MMRFDSFLTDVSDRYQVMFGQQGPQYDQVFATIAQPILTDIAASDAPYHTVEHTLQVMAVGQAILEGKQHYEGSVSPSDWLHMLVALLCHDIGYVRGICRGDRPEHHQYVDGKGGYLHLIPAATGAALADHHVDRSQVYVATQLSQHACLDIATVQWNIEMTRFPAPDQALYRDMHSYAGLCRAADLLGQLSDPHYLQKLPALFDEFEETGLNDALGYTTPTDLKVNYPDFYHHVVQPFIQPSISYLAATLTGRKYIAQLYTNVRLARLAQPPSDETAPYLKQLEDETELISWQEAGFTFPRAAVDKSRG